jgi:hypothetical protein
MSLRAPLALLLGAACQLPQVADSGFGGATELTGAPSTGADSSSSGQGSGETTAVATTDVSTGAEPAETTQSLVLDVGNHADIGDGKPAGCRGKIDFLFVISRDAPMYTVHTRLIKAFPQFIATIESKFADFDYHIMVIDADESWGLSTCDEKCVDTGTCNAVPGYPCDKLDLVTQCDRMIGAGNVFSAGWQAYNKPCAIAGGKRFLTHTQPDLPETFKCIAQVGNSGRGRLGEALAAAMSTQLGGIGGCNDGFLRDDALLMVSLIGGWDEEGTTTGSAGTPEAWTQAVIDAKNGEPDSVVMLNIGDPSFPWQDRLWQMVNVFRYGLVTDSGDLDYGPAFDAATEMVEEACRGFSPPG